MHDTRGYNMKILIIAMMIFSACKTTMEIEETKIESPRSQSEIKKVDWNLIFEDNTKKNQKKTNKEVLTSQEKTSETYPRF